MNMQRYVVKISLLSVLLFSCDRILLGMKCAEQTTVTVYQKPRTFFPVELMIRVAAEGSGEVKNRLKETCGFFSKMCTKDNLEFLSNPSFTAHKKDIEDIICSAAWFNNVQKEQALARYNVEKINFTVTFQRNSHKAALITTLNVNHIKILRNKYNNSDDLCWVLDPAFYCAVRCNDLEAVHNIAPKIKEKAHSQRLYSSSKFHMMDLHKCLLIQIIQKDREELFKIVVQNDRFNVLNAYDNFKLVAAYQRPFLDVLINSNDISQDLKNKYSSLYRECGGKSLAELEAEKKQSCIIF